MARNTKTLILVVVAVLLFFVLSILFASSRATLNQAQADKIKADWGRDAQDAANEFGVPVVRILAIIGTESKGVENPPPQPAGEKGLMQITPGAWETVSEGVPFDQATIGRVNIFAGTHYLANLVERYGDLDTATGYYNARTLVNRLIYINRVRGNELFF